MIGRATDDEICHGAVEVLSDYRAFHLEEEEDRGGLGAQALTVALLGEGGRADRESTDMLLERLRAGGLPAGRPGLGSPVRWFSVGAMRKMTLASTSSDGLTISGHFGHVKQFVAMEAHEGAEIERSVRQTADTLPIETLHRKDMTTTPCWISSQTVTRPWPGVWESRWPTAPWRVASR